jgi:serine/threonine protein phosphatase PrpC
MPEKLTPTGMSVIGDKENLDEERRLRMIRSYGFSSVGSSHLNKGAGCQDANNCVLTRNGFVVAAIADGVGSCKYSDVASSIAVDVSVRVCVDEIEKGGATCDLLEVIEKAFTQAERAIADRSLSENHLITDYDTTLSLAIYDGQHVTYGHSGDGGIIGLTVEGDYVKITSPQKSEGFYVVPLRAGKDSWVIDCAKDKFTSILLATDGVYDVFFPYLLKGQPVEVYVPLIRYFMDNNILKVSAKTIDAIGKSRKDYLDSDICSSIIDDKTVLVLINENVLPKLKDDSYYAEPDWATLQLIWNKKAYPHLYKEEGKEAKEEGKEETEKNKKHKVSKRKISLKLRKVKKIK